jgi:MFS transporter, BCD family, chlorophyll transporter
MFDPLALTWKLLRSRGRVDWTRVATRWLPFADVATPELPLAQLLRLALFQLSVGMVAVLTVGTLNRVMIVELGVGAWLVSLMVALPILFAPFRALVGFRSDEHKSPLGWRRVPYVWFGSGAQFAGLAIMPFALVLFEGTTAVQLFAAHAAAALAFLLAGAGAQVVQTAGLALATDRATEATRPRVVALMYVMLLLGMVGSGALFGWLLAEYTPTRLVQVVQGVAVAALLLNAVAVWKQEARDPERGAWARRRAEAATVRFADRWATFSANRPRRALPAGRGPGHRRLQHAGHHPRALRRRGARPECRPDHLAHRPDGARRAAGLCAGRAPADARRQRRTAGRARPARRPGRLFDGGLRRAPGFAGPVPRRRAAHRLWRRLFSVGTLSAAMAMAPAGQAGMVLGAWGGVVATAAGLSIALGGALRDLVGHAAMGGSLGEALAIPATGYAFVYHLELALLFVTLAVLGPLVTRRRTTPTPAAQADNRSGRFGLADFPG